MRPLLSTFVVSTALLLSVPALPVHSAFADDAPAAGAAKSHAESVENRIKELHDQLRITAGQEDLWGKVTAEMRDSAKTAHEQAEARTQKASTMSAIDDLKSYAEIAKTHAESMGRFVDVFSPLYAAMSDDQKKNADEFFRKHKEARAKKHKAALKQ